MDRTYDGYIRHNCSLWVLSVMFSPPGIPKFLHQNLVSIPRWVGLYGQWVFHCWEDLIYKVLVPYHHLLDECPIVSIYVKANSYLRWKIDKIVLSYWKINRRSKIQFIKIIEYAHLQVYRLLLCLWAWIIDQTSVNNQLHPFPFPPRVYQLQIQKTWIGKPFEKNVK